MNMLTKGMILMPKRNFPENHMSMVTKRKERRSPTTLAYERLLLSFRIMRANCIFLLNILCR